MKCRLCGHEELTGVLSLGEQAYSGIFPQPGEEVPTGHLGLVRCDECELVQLDRYFNSTLLYGLTYGYRSGLNKSMVQHLHGKREVVEKWVTLDRNSVVLDIASSDGTLLNGFESTGARLIGFDSQAEKFKEHYSPKIERVPLFFSPAEFSRQCKVDADVVTTIAMFYGINDPVSFAREVAQILAPQGVWHLEQSYLPLMMKAIAFDAICQEHACYYGLKQMHRVMDQVGLKIIEADYNMVNGGSFAVTVAHKEHTAPNVCTEEFLAAEQIPLETWGQFRQAVLESIATVSDFLGGVDADGKIVHGLGASTKGNVLLQCVTGANDDSISAISDVNEDKWGKVTPGTNIPIISEQESRAMKPDYYLVLPWHFRDGIIEREQAFLERGGGLVFPLPEFEIVTKESLEGDRRCHFCSGAGQDGGEECGTCHGSGVAA